MSLIDFQNTYNIKTIFLEYGAFCLRITNYLRWMDIAEGSTVYPCNSYLNVLLSRDRKGVSCTYRQLMGKNENIIANACEKWSDRLTTRKETFSMRKSFIKINLVDDVYLRYIQFRTLHRRFYTNDILYKIKSKDSSLCEICNDEMYSIEHMLITCSKTQHLWREVELWLSEMGLTEYTIDEQKMILGENQKSYWINVVILITKKVIFNAKLNGKVPNLFSVKYQTRILYNHEELKFSLIQKNDLFQKRWGIP